MSSPGSRMWPFLAGIAVVGAGLGGASLRHRLEIGTIPSAVVADVDSRTLVASTQSVTGVSESEFFYQLLDLIKQQFVDPVKDEQALATGAVRGMINSLSDPNATFYSDEQFPAYLKSLEGEYQGIGVELELKYDLVQLKKFYATQAKLAEWNATGRKEIDGKREELPDLEPGALIPDVMVSAVVPGSPAELAGIKPGDMVDGVDGKWSLNRHEVAELNAAFDKIRLNKMDRDAYQELRKKYIARSENAISPSRLRDRLMTGTKGAVKLYWRTPGAKDVRSASIEKAVTQVQALSGERLMFVKGADRALEEALRNGKASFDLRNSGFGDFETMTAALRVLLPAGNYGVLETEKQKAGTPFKVEGTGKADAKVVLIVDPSTVGAAKFFAKVAQAAGQAELQGTLDPSPTMFFETVKIQGGAGYVIPTGIFKGKEATS